MLFNVPDEIVGKSGSCDNAQRSSLSFLLASPRTDRRWSACFLNAVGWGRCAEVEVIACFAVLFIYPWEVLCFHAACRADFQTLPGLLRLSKKNPEAVHALGISSSWCRSTTVVMQRWLLFSLGWRTKNKKSITLQYESPCIATRCCIYSSAARLRLR